MIVILKFPFSFVSMKTYSEK